MRKTKLVLTGAPMWRRLGVAVCGLLFGVISVTPALAEPPSDTSADGDAEVTAKFGDGVNVASAVGKFSLQLRARIQMRAEFLALPDDDEGPITRFMLRRVRLSLKGNAGSKNLTYTIQLGFSNLDNEPDMYNPIRDAYLSWTELRDLSLRFGQMKVPYGVQRVISSSKLGMADRSIVTNELNLDRDVGAYFYSDDLFGLGHRLGYNLGVFGGDGRNRIGDRWGLLWIARLKYMPVGAIDDLSEGDLERSSKPRLLIGVSGAFNKNTSRPRSTTGLRYPVGDFDYLHADADFMFKWYGFFAMGELLYRHTLRSAATGDVNGVPTTVYSRSGWGAYAQVGQMLNANLELTGRFGYVTPHDSVDPTFEANHELGAAVSYYFVGHDLKIQADYFNLGAKLFGEESEHQARLQMQMYF